MAKQPLSDRLNQLKPERVDLSGDSDDPKPGLVYQNYSLDITATEKQMKHLATHMRMIKIKFDFTGSNRL